MRAFINYLETLKGDKKIDQELLTDLIKMAEQAFAKELWDNIPVVAGEDYVRNSHKSNSDVKQDTINTSRRSNNNNNHIFNVNNKNTLF